MKKFLSLLRIETIFIHMSGCRIFFFQKKKWKNSNIPNFNHHGSLMSQGFHTLFLYQSRFPHLVSMWVKVSTPCQGFHTLPRFPLLFLCESRFPHLAKVSTPCFYMSQGFHTLSIFPHLAKVPTPCQGYHTLFLSESRFPHLAKVPTPCFYISQGFHTLPRFPHLVSM